MTFVGFGDDGVRRWWSDSRAGAGQVAAWASVLVAYRHVDPPGGLTVLTTQPPYGLGLAADTIGIAALIDELDRRDLIATQEVARARQHAVLEEQVSFQIRRLFPLRSRRKATAMLQPVKDDVVRLAVLKLSNGDTSALAKAVAAAEREARDVLAWAFSQPAQVPPHQSSASRRRPSGKKPCNLCGAVLRDAEWNEHLQTIHGV